MAWPPPVLPTNRTDATPQGPGTHSGDHNLANQAINDIVPQLQTVLSKLSGTGTGGLGNIGKVVYGSTPAGTINAGTSVKVANALTLPAGLWAVVYQGLLSSGAPIAVECKMFGVQGAASFNVVYTAPMVGSYAAVSPFILGLSVGGACSVDISNNGTAVVSTFADVTNHHFFAIGLTA